MTKYILFSKNPAKIVCEDSSFELSGNNQLILDKISNLQITFFDNDYKNMFIKNDKYLLTYSSKCYFCNKFKKYHLKNDKFLNFQLFVDKNIGNFKCKILGYPLQLIYTLNDESYSICIEHSTCIENVSLENINNNPVFMFDKKEKTYTILFDSDSKKFVTICGDVSVEKNEIYINENLQTICGHGYEHFITFESDGKIEDNKTLVYLFSKPLSPQSKLSTAYAFLECLYIEDFSLAQTLLQNEKKLSAKNAKKFLGAFDEFEYFEKNTFYIWQEISPNNFQGKLIKFVFENNKISDILEIDD